MATDNLSVERAKSAFIEGVEKVEAGRYVEAELCFRRSLEFLPERISTLGNLCAVLIRLGRWEEAQSLNAKILQLDPENEQARIRKAAILRDSSGEFESAIALLKDLLHTSHDKASVHFQLGLSYRDTANLVQAERHFKLAAQLNPANWENWFQLASAQNSIAGDGPHPEVISTYRRAGEVALLQPVSSQRYGAALINAKEFELARQFLITSLEKYPENIELHANLMLFARCQFNRGDFESTLQILQTYEATQPLTMEGVLLRGVSYESLSMHVQAIATYQKAIKSGLTSADIYNNLGTAESNAGNFIAALSYLDRAIALCPHHEEYHLNRALTKYRLKDFKAAESDLMFAIKSDSTRLKAIELCIELRRAVCDWTDVDNLQKTLHSKLDQALATVHPYSLLITEDVPEKILSAAESWAAKFHRQNNSSSRSTNPKALDRLRIGYFSSDLNSHAIGHLTASLFALHNKKNFEIYAFDIGPATTDALSQRIRRAVEHYMPARELSDRAIRDLCAEHDIHIAVDMNGYTKGARTGLFASGLAPIQVNYLGYPGTLGAQFYDYIVADPVLIPPEFQRFYKEKILYLPDTYQPNQPYVAAHRATLTRTDEALPSDAFVFCNFNNNFKITPEVFATWMRILKQVPDSVIWLLEDNEIAKGNLLREAEQLGIAAHRLIFARRVGLEQHLARQSLADLFLDTFPYTAHTTASDALRSGLPIVTRMGLNFASRVAGSLLNAAGLSECIVNSEQEYVEFAIDLACNPAKINAIKEKLQSGLSTCPLFDTERYVRNLEQGMLEIWQHHRNGFPPAHRYVQTVDHGSGQLLEAPGLRPIN